MNTTSEDVIRAMFDTKQARDLEKLRKVNQELKPYLERSTNLLLGKIDVNTLSRIQEKK